jgi:hypothetical protein
MMAASSGEMEEYAHAVIGIIKPLVNMDRKDMVTEESTEGQQDKERWNRPRINAYRFAVTLYSFTIMGMNDAVIGALIPYV